MTLARALYSRVANDATVNVKIGVRFRPGVMEPSDILPFADYLITGDRNDKHSSGATTARFATVEITAYATTHDESETIANLIRTSLESFTGTASGVANVHIIRITELDGSDQPDLGARGQSKGPFPVSRFFSVFYGFK